MLVVSTGFIVNPSLYAKVPYDPIKDFVAAHPGRGIAERADRQSVGAAKSVKELIALIKANPASTASPSPPSARRRISPANCSSSRSGSTW